MPKSQVRKKKVYTPPTDVRPTTTTAATRKPSPVWLPATAVALIVAGIGWLVVYYLSEQEYPVASWGYWNLAVGFGCDGQLPGAAVPLALSPALRRPPRHGPGHRVRPQPGASASGPLWCPQGGVA